MGFKEQVYDPRNYTKKHESTQKWFGFASFRVFPFRAIFVDRPLFPILIKLAANFRNRTLAEMPTNSSPPCSRLSLCLSVSVAILSLSSGLLSSELVEIMHLTPARKKRSLLIFVAAEGSPAEGRRVD